MSRHIQRSKITDAVIEVLRDTGRQVGDAQIPRDGAAGWIGQPNAEGTNFVPYSVVTPQPAQMGTGSLTVPGEEIWFIYAISNFGVSRSQCEDQADLMRHALTKLRDLDVPQWTGTSDAYGRRIQTVVVTSYGAVQPMGDTDPKIYGQTDTVSLWTTG